MRRSPIAISILVAALPSAALAWNHTGHRLSAIIAFDRLKAENPDRAAELIELLKQHPYFDRDFNRKMPPAVRDGPKADQDRWVFAQAATWPDIVRSRSHPGHEQHHHATWHYVNEPTFLDPATRDRLNIDSVVNRVRTWKPGMRSSKMEVLELPAARAKGRRMKITMRVNGKERKIEYLRATGKPEPGRFVKTLGS